MLKVFNRQGVVVDKISGYSDFHIKTELNNYDRTMSFRIPYRLIEGIVENEGYIETKTDRFVIQSVKPDSDSGMCEVTACLDMEALEGKAIMSFDSTEKTISECLSLAFAGTGWTVGSCNVSKKRTVRLTMKTALDVMRQAEAVYRCYIIPNAKAKRVDIYADYGSDTGVYFRSGFNMSGFRVTKTSGSFFTEIEPYGKDGLTIESVNSNVKYLTNHQYSNKVKRLIWKDERYTVAASLKEDAAAKLADMSKPYVSYEGSVRDLAKISDTYSLLTYNLGDTVTIIDDETGTREKQRIVEIDQYPDEPDRDSCTLANKVLTFDELTQRYQDAVDTVENVTSDNGTIDGSTVDEIESRQIVDLENTVIQFADIQSLIADDLTVTGWITAVEGEFGSLLANIGSFETLTANRLTAAEAAIGTLQADALTANSAIITTLQSDYGNIEHLLSGNAGTGTLSTVVLNASNASIDASFINNLIANSATINQLRTANIITDNQKVMSQDGTFEIDGSTMTIKDENDNVRIQIGQDALGDFTFTLFDDTGSGVLIDAAGIKEGAIADGLIKNAKVANDANIAASKLDIASLFNVINNDGTHTINDTKIYLSEEGQTLSVAFSQLTQDVDVAEAAAQSAITAAERAIDAISGIDVLSTMNISLSNDAHVVHTETDGSGGDYSDCSTVVSVYLGDTNISSSATLTYQASSGVTGTWTAGTRTYQVTALSGDNGYVDFDALYGTERRILTTRTGKSLTTRTGKSITARTGGLHLQKRFSISKARDGQIGKAYRISSSADVIKKNLDGSTFTPGTLTFSASYNTGASVIPYLGILVIEESADGVNFTEKYRSAAGESSKTYTPTSYNLKSIRCRLYDSTETMEYDSQSVLMLMDTESLHSEVSTISSTQATYTAAFDQLALDYASVKTDYYGTKAGSLLLQTPYTRSGDNITFTAKVYQSGQDITSTIPSYEYQWLTRTEEGDVYLGTGYSKTVDSGDLGYGGCIICRLFVVEARALTTRTGKKLTTRTGKVLTGRVA